MLRSEDDIPGERIGQLCPSFQRQPTRLCQSFPACAHALLEELNRGLPSVAGNLCSLVSSHGEHDTGRSPFVTK